MSAEGLSAEEKQACPWLSRFTKLLVFATLVLIFLGGQVKSHDAGLSVPDWPNSFGENMFLFPWSKWVGGIFHEHVHRLVASLVGLLAIVAAVWLTLRERRRWVKNLSYAALAAVIVQGILGGLTVLYLLPAAISASHAVLAQTFLVMTIVIAYSQSKERARRAAESPRGKLPAPAKAAIALFVLVYAQLMVGAAMRHMEAGLAVPDFPTQGGHLLPWFDEEAMTFIHEEREYISRRTGRTLEPVTMAQIWIHMAHRLGALLVTVAAAAAGVLAYRRRNDLPAAWEAAYFTGVLIWVQAGFGAYTIWSMRTPLITSVHVVTGALVLGGCTLLVLRTLPLSSRKNMPIQPEPAPSSA